MYFSNGKCLTVAFYNYTLCLTFEYTLPPNAERQNRDKNL